jgi:GH24 family phage-related lysozyme (muramidase)
MKIGKAGLDLIKSFEGYHTKQPDGSVKAYLDKLVRPALRSPGYKGLWTIGWGNTGPNVTEGTHWSRRKAESELLKMVARHEKAVMKVVKVPLDQNEFDALVSLSYNMGIGKAKTLIAKLNRGDKRGAANAFLLYNKAGGKVVRGLARRREAERKLFLKWTKKDIVEESTTLTVTQRIKKSIASLGITTAAVSQFFFDVWGWVKDNPETMAFAVLGLTATIYLLANWVEDRRMKEYDEGRYTPPNYEEE